MASRVANLYASKEEVRAFVDRLQRKDSSELYKLRAQIASRLKALVASLVVAPLGDRPKSAEVIGFLRDQSGASDVISHIEARIVSGDGDAPYFAIGFRNGAVWVVYPTEGSPLEYRQQVVADDNGMRILSTEVDAQGSEFVNLLM